MSRLFNLLRATRAVKQAHFMDRAEMLKLQERRWRAMARYALEVSPFYRRHLAGIDVERCQLTDIPPLNKETLLENWDEIVPDRRLHRAALEEFLSDPKNWGKLMCGRWMVSTTSGTTGNSLIVPHDIAAVDWGHVGQNLRNSASPHSATMPPLALFRRRLKIIAFVTSKSPAVSAALYDTRPWVGEIFCTYHRVNVTAPWAEILAEVQRLQPDAFIGYASLFGRLAQSQLNGELNIRLHPERGFILAGGDTVTDGIRDLCRKAFGMAPFNTYGCGEVLGMARQWRGMEHLHCHDDMLVFEAVDAADQPVPDGVLSNHALVTPLINKALPLLRYRINDRVRLGPVHEHWPFKRIEQVYGRSTMSYAFSVPEKRVFIGANFLFVMDHRKDVALYQMRQSGPAAVECLVVPQPGVCVAELTTDLQTQLRQCLDAGDCQGVQCAVRLLPEIPPDPRTGKVEHNVPLPDETA